MRNDPPSTPSNGVSAAHYAIFSPSKSALRHKSAAQIRGNSSNTACVMPTLRPCIAISASLPLAATLAASRRIVSIRGRLRSNEYTHRIYTSPRAAGACRSSFSSTPHATYVAGTSPPSTPARHIDTRSRQVFSSHNTQCCKKLLYASFRLRQRNRSSAPRTSPFYTPCLRKLHSAYKPFLQRYALDCCSLDPRLPFLPV